MLYVFINSDLSFKLANLILKPLATFVFSYSVVYPCMFFSASIFCGFSLQVEHKIKKWKENLDENEPRK